MSETMAKAIKLLKETSCDFGTLTDILSADIKDEDFDKVSLAYKISAILDVYASQLSGETKTVEGACHIDNKCAKVVINGVSLRDKMKFEIMIDGNWVSGHRENSQYGQVFNAKEKGMYLLTAAYKGRVNFPLQMDD